MSSIYTALKLVNSLSGSEKRHFKLVRFNQKGDKDYQGLFDIIEGNPLLRPTEIAAQFQTKYRGSSLDNAARYLIKVITDSLIQTKIEKDRTFELLHSLMRLKVFQERSLTAEASHELKKIRKTAELSQNYLMQYVASRYELDHISSLNFPGLTDLHLIEMQMKAKESLRIVHHIEGHYALYELLRYRLIRHRGIASEEDKKKLNDLILSELSLITGKAKNTYESKKLHLLFQSFFFTHTWDHKSALKTFQELNKHFERNADLQEHPPISYYSSLDGILDSMRSSGNLEQMPFYIEKVKNIDTSSCPDHFRYLLQLTITVYTIALKLAEHDYNGAIDYIETLDPRLFEAYHLINVEKRFELFFYCSLAYFGKKEYKKALKFVKGITSEDSKHVLFPIYKAIRILYIIIHYELRNIPLVASEIRSYKRFFQQKTSLFKSEKLVFKVIQFDPFLKTGAKNKALTPKILLYCKTINADKYERTLLKYYDLDRWASSKFNAKFKA